MSSGIIKYGPDGKLLENCRILIPNTGAIIGFFPPFVTPGFIYGYTHYALNADNFLLVEFLTGYAEPMLNCLDFQIYADGSRAFLTTSNLISSTPIKLVFKPKTNVSFYWRAWIQAGAALPSYCDLQTQSYLFTKKDDKRTGNLGTNPPTADPPTPWT